MKLVQICISGINELRWIGTEHFQTEDHTVYYSGHGKQRRNSTAFLLREGITFDYNAMKDQIISIRLYG